MQTAALKTDTQKVKIEVKNLTKRFGDLLVLNRINFHVAQGEFLAIVGPTGCGKTTFLNCLSKLMPTSEGDIFIDGEVAGLLGLVNRPGGFSADDSRLAEIFDCEVPARFLAPIGSSGSVFAASISATGRKTRR